MKPSRYLIPLIIIFILQIGVPARLSRPSDIAGLAVDPAEWEGWEQAEETVKNLPCSKGGTVDQYLTKKAEVPAVEDLGWHVYPRKNGFEVERLLLLNQKMSLEYRWHVDLTGKVKAINNEAIGITR
ncbi:MAG: hypothetical protein JYX80_13780 [Candidatus Scalindua sediminis]|nr:hypothetical protein [Candidatus Scalindua sediminis]